MKTCIKGSHAALGRLGTAVPETPVRKKVEGRLQDRWKGTHTVTEKDDAFVSGRLKSLCCRDGQSQRCLQRAEGKKMPLAGAGRGSSSEQVYKRKSGCTSQSED